MNGFAKAARDLSLQGLWAVSHGMNADKMAFSQVMARIPHWEFRRLALPYDQDDGRQQFSSWGHFLTPAFAQMTFRESLRDIEACVSTQPCLVFHSGFHTRITRALLAQANEKRDWRLFSALVQKLIDRARDPNRDEPGVLDLDAPVCAVDSTLIELSPSLCLWANWSGREAALKLKVALNLRGPLSAFPAVTPAEHTDIKWLDNLPIESGSFYWMGRGGVDSRRLRRIADTGAFFVIRKRADVKYYVAISRPVERSTYVRADQSIRFNTRYVGSNWPDSMRHVKIIDTEKSRGLAFWTNQWTLPAATIAGPYRQRRQIKLFFRQVQQSIRIRSSYGTFPNSVRIQLSTAICTYLAIATTRTQIGTRTIFTPFVEVLSLHALSKVPLQELLTKPDTSEPHLDRANQREFNDLC